MRLIHCAALSVAAVLVAGLASNPPTTIIRNVTKSMPLGWYLRNPFGKPDRESIIMFKPPSIALVHGWPADVPLLKRVAATGGDKVCSDGIALTINNALVGLVTKRLKNGRPAPVWTGCQVLRPDQVFPIATGLPDSLDGRAYGPISVSDIAGVFVPVWTWEAF